MKHFYKYFRWKTGNQFAEEDTVEREAGGKMLNCMWQSKGTKLRESDQDSEDGNGL